METSLRSIAGIKYVSATFGNDRNVFETLRNLVGHQENLGDDDIKYEPEDDGFENGSVAVPSENNNDNLSELKNAINLGAVDHTSGRPSTWFENGVETALTQDSKDESFVFGSLRDLVRETAAPSSPQCKRVWRRRGPRRKTRTCDQCGFVTKTSGDLIKHKKYRHGSAIFECPVEGCSFRTKYPNNIKHHLSKHSDVRPYKCTECSRSFKRKNQLATHATTHSDERPFACSQCDFRAKRNWVLTSHVATKHSDARPFACDICGFRMKMRSDLKKHQRTHSREKKFLCDECGKAFTMQSSMLKHQRYMHRDIKLIPCTEEECERRFKTKSALQKHLLVHRGIKEFECSVCSHRFSSKNNMEKHAVVHDTIDRPFSCPVCPFRGKEEMHVRSHLGSMHGHLRLFNCDLCHVRFKDQHKLNQHYNTNKHRRNRRFALPPNDSEVKLEPGEEAATPALPVVDKVFSLGGCQLGEDVTVKIEPPSPGPAVDSTMVVGGTELASNGSVEPEETQVLLSNIKDEAECQHLDYDQADYALQEKHSALPTVIKIEPFDSEAVGEGISYNEVPSVLEPYIHAVKCEEPLDYSNNNTCSNHGQ